MADLASAARRIDELAALVHRHGRAHPLLPYSGAHATLGDLADVVKNTPRTISTEQADRIVNERLAKLRGLMARGMILHDGTDKEPADYDGGHVLLVEGAYLGNASRYGCWHRVFAYTPKAVAPLRFTEFVETDTGPVNSTRKIISTRLASIRERFDSLADVRIITREAGFFNRRVYVYFHVRLPDNG